MNLTQEYCALAAALQNFLGEEFPKGHLLSTDPETYAFFAKEVKAFKARPPTLPPPPATKPTGERNPVFIPEKAELPKPPQAPVESKKAIQRSAPKPALAAATPPKHISVPKDPKQISLDLLPEPIHDPLLDMRRTVAELFPQLRLFNAPPDDSEARRIKNPFAILLLVHSETAEELAFLETVVKGITERLALAGLQDVVHWNPGHERLILLTPNAKAQINNSSNTKTIELKEIKKYMNDPLEKRQLWQQICLAKNF